MEREDKELLLKDLCARLPYEVKVKFYDHWVDEYEIIPLTAKLLSDTVYIGDIRPYLFPLSSMTEEQIKEFNSITQKCNTYIGKSILITDFCNKHHIDWRGFIEKGFAINATGLNIY